jgi:V-type H+-transporting ATPase subunit a
LIKNFDTEEYVHPTFIETNEVTMPFQEIVNTYSVPKYKEINPTIFTVVTFPFLFGVMFGDIMHGALLFIFASILCFSERKPGTAMGELGKVRYLLLLMGFFSFYCGFVYNDFTSIPLKVLQDSCYNIPHDPKTTPVTIKDDCVYKFGADPSWYLGKNELAVMNSLKMKLSVILGVS